MYSFYGGRPGNSFVIITTFRSVDEMITQFQQGPNYTAVHYDEYVMINTTNKNNPENGRIYRRGYNFNNDKGGAEYIGTIVGPAGKAPILKLTTPENVDDQYNSEGYEERYSEGQYSKQNGNLVPGKTENGKYNDNITWKSYSVRNEDNEDTTAYIGFTIPYMVIDFETIEENPYKNGQYADTTSIERRDEENHPFYEKWRIHIPKGIKGDALKNFKVITASNDDGVQSYDDQLDDRTNNRQILVYDYYNYDNKEDGDPKRIYLGDYNMIKNVNLSNDGILTVSYTHDNDKNTFPKIKWINNIELNSQGHFQVTYNTKTNGQSDTYSTDLDWIKGIKIDNEGTIKLQHSYAPESLATSPKLRWCTGVNLDVNGNLTFNWNNMDENNENSTTLGPIQWIDSINLNAHGILSVTYNILENDGETHKKQVFNDDKIKWIKSVNLNATGDLIITYNIPALDENNNIIKDENNNIVYETEVFNHALKTISEITHNSQVESEETHQMNHAGPHGGTLQIAYNDNSVDQIPLDYVTDFFMEDTTGNVYVEWNDISPAECIGTVNYISDLAIDSGGNLLVLYSDQEHHSGMYTINGISGYTLLGKVAPYGNNVNMTISRIVRGKYFIENNKPYLEFYIENAGVLRVLDRAQITGGTATVYYNNQLLTTTPISLSGMMFQVEGDNTDELNTFNFKIELDSPYSAINNPPQLVDIELNDVVMEITRINTADVISNVEDQQEQISANATKIADLQIDVGDINNNLNTINQQLKNLKNDTTTFNTINLNNSFYMKSLSGQYIQQPIMFLSGTTTVNQGKINGKSIPNDKYVILTNIKNTPYATGYRVVPFVSRRFNSVTGMPRPDDYGDFLYSYYDAKTYDVCIKTTQKLSTLAIYQYDYMLYAIPQ